MKRLLVIVCCFAAVFAGSSSAAEPTDEEVRLRNDVIELAGAFQNDGFKLRDGHWFGTSAADKPAALAVNLYSGNAYWFTAAGSGSESIKISIYDDAGRPVESEPYQNANRAAAGFSPDASGLYYVRVSLEQGTQPATFCLIYLYK
jgi:hypothetical protein